MLLLKENDLIISVDYHTLKQVIIIWPYFTLNGAWIDCFKFSPEK